MIDHSLPFHLRAKSLLERVTYPGLTFEVQQEVDGRNQLRVQCPKGVHASTGLPWAWNGRWWRLSEHMTDSEVVSTAFKAVTTALEHEAREAFQFDAVPIYDSHLSIYALKQIRREGHLDER